MFKIFMMEPLAVRCRGFFFAATDGGLKPGHGTRRMWLHLSHY